MIFHSNNGKSFSKGDAIDLMVSLSATDANSEKKWRGFYNSLSQLLQTFPSFVSSFVIYLLRDAAYKEGLNFCFGGWLGMKIPVQMLEKFWSFYFLISYFNYTFISYFLRICDPVSHYKKVI